MEKHYYLTTPIYYVNDIPHIGHAYTTLAADIIARYWRQKIGEDNVFFLTGTDEHGQKVEQTAEDKGLSPKEFVDEIAPRFKKAWKLLNIDYSYFIRTTNPKHERVVSEILQKIHKAGFIYKAKYKGLYCVGCEKFLTESELINGKCPLHPNKDPVYQEEENYFLKLKELSKKVLEKIEKGNYKILPQERENEIVSRLKQGVEDISISRAGVSWGIPIPWDKRQTIYVWVDALFNYYSATRFVKGKKKFWPADLHLVGKDILWFHSVIWQALLIAAGLELPKNIFAHGYFTIDGQKMSKSLGNVISPKELVKRYGVDGTRYLLISAYPFGSDGDISLKRLDVSYNAFLANSLGNLVSRLSKLCEGITFHNLKSKPALSKSYQTKLENYKFSQVLNNLQAEIKKLDQYINDQEPWKITDKEKLKKVLKPAVNKIRLLARELKPFLPETALKIKKQFKGPKIRTAKVLFPRIS